MTPVSDRPLPRDHEVPWWLRQAGRVQGLRPALVPAADVDACRRLLFRVYHQERGWDPPAGNPSGLRVDRATGRLLDAFDDSVIWLGLYRGPELVACCRVILPEAGRALEVARYHPIPVELTEGALEANRLGVLPGQRGGGAFALLAMMLWWYARAERIQRLLIAVEEPISRALFRPLGWTFTGVRFRYDASDPHACELLVMHPDGGHVLRSIGKTLGRAAARALLPQAPQT